MTTALRIIYNCMAVPPPDIGDTRVLVDLDHDNVLVLVSDLGIHWIVENLGEGDIERIIYI